MKQEESISISNTNHCS